MKLAVLDQSAAEDDDIWPNSIRLCRRGDSEKALQLEGERTKSQKDAWTVSYCEADLFEAMFVQTCWSTNNGMCNYEAERNVSNNLYIMVACYKNKDTWE